MERKFIVFADAIKLLGLSRQTINRFIYAGEIPCYKVGKRWLFDKEELIEWVKSKRKEPKKPPAPRPRVPRSKKKASQ